jgi:hypothetical protein
MNVSPFRFFVIVCLHPAHHLAVLAAVVFIGLWTIAMSAGELDSALGMLLFVQMFLASSGFLVRARRGHFDLILACTSSSGRARVLASHWLASVLPGFLGWTLVCVTAWSLGGGAWSFASIGSRFAALLIVSALAWTAGLALPRGAGGALWAAGLVAALLYRVDFVALTMSSSTPITLFAAHTAAIVLCPFLLLGTHAPIPPGAIAAGACTAGLLLLSVWRFADRLDFYLRDRA